MSMWKKIKQFLSSQSDDAEVDDSEFELVNFQTKDPIDVLFTKNFISSGGQFFYCENEQETLSFLNEIVDNVQVDEITCFDDRLKSLLNRLNVKQTSEVNSAADFAFIGCEYLSAFDGAIMLSSRKTKGYLVSNLPQNLIVFATPKQFVSNVSEGLQKIRTQNGRNIHSITSIRGKRMHNFDSSSTAKNIYLLLVESA